MKIVLLVFMFFTFSPLFGQEKVNFNDLYYEDFLAYQDSDDELFTGIAQKIRKNGHLVYEEIYENGILKKSTVYYNGKEKKLDRVILYYEKTFDSKTEIYYDLKKPIIEYRHFDKNGKKTLVEIYTDKLLTYRCEYLKGKKHGMEFCLNDDGTTFEKSFSNGKKAK